MRSRAGWARVFLDHKKRRGGQPPKAARRFFRFAKFAGERQAVCVITASLNAHAASPRVAPPTALNSRGSPRRGSRKICGLRLPCQGFFSGVVHVPWPSHPRPFPPASSPPPANPHPASTASPIAPMTIVWPISGAGPGNAGTESGGLPRRSAGSWGSLPRAPCGPIPPGPGRRRAGRPAFEDPALP